METRQEPLTLSPALLKELQFFQFLGVFPILVLNFHLLSMAELNVFSALIHFMKIKQEKKDFEVTAYSKSRSSWIQMLTNLNSYLISVYKR